MCVQNECICGLGMQDDGLCATSIHYQILKCLFLIFQFYGTLTWNCNILLYFLENHLFTNDQDQVSLLLYVDYFKMEFFMF